jgi:hypothetical protein
MIRTLVVVAAAALAFAVSPAFALHAPSDGISPAQSHYNPNAYVPGYASPALARSIVQAATQTAPPPVEIVHVVKPGGFAWREFGIGAGAASSVALALLALGLLRRRGGVAAAPVVGS